LSDLPNLATSAPLWLSLLTVFVNAVVGGARARTDASQPWDIVGLTVFALLMGLGGGFIRDVLIGNLPAESLRTPWALCTVVASMLIVLALGRHLDRLRSLMSFLNAVAMGLFAVTGAAYALDFGLPAVSAVLVGTVSAVGGGVLVSALQAQVSSILVASTPNALIALTGALTFVLLAFWSAPLAAICGMVAVLVAQYLVDLTGLRTRPAVI
jgi:uncharacterized membrane protein YeiH